MSSSYDSRRGQYAPDDPRARARGYRETERLARRIRRARARWERMDALDRAALLYALREAGAIPSPTVAPAERDDGSREVRSSDVPPEDPRQLPLLPDDGDRWLRRQRSRVERALGLAPAAAPSESAVHSCASCGVDRSGHPAGKWAHHPDAAFITRLCGACVDTLFFRTSPPALPIYVNGETGAERWWVDRTDPITRRRLGPADIFRMRLSIVPDRRPHQRRKAPAPPAPAPPKTAVEEEPRGNRAPCVAVGCSGEAARSFGASSIPLGDLPKVRQLCHGCIRTLYGLSGQSRAPVTVRVRPVDRGGGWSISEWTSEGAKDHYRIRARLLRREEDA